MEIAINGKNIIFDDEDYNLICGKKWYVVKDRNTYYATTSKTRMHRLIMNAKPGEIIDHINGNGLDNRRSNLRFCNASENSCNSKRVIESFSGLKGVYLHTKARRWYSQICKNGKKIHLGYFNDPKSAHEAYCLASEKYHGEFGRTE
jgi:hypothetical protein